MELEAYERLLTLSCYLFCISAGNHPKVFRASGCVLGIEVTILQTLERIESKKIVNWFTKQSIPRSSYQMPIVTDKCNL
jgi:hypothetical protein